MKLDKHLVVWAVVSITITLLRLSDHDIGRIINMCGEFYESFTRWLSDSWRHTVHKYINTATRYASPCVLSMCRRASSGSPSYRGLPYDQSTCGQRHSRAAREGDATGRIRSLKNTKFEKYIYKVWKRPNTKYVVWKNIYIKSEKGKNIFLFQTTNIHRLKKAKYVVWKGQKCTKCNYKSKSLLSTLLVCIIIFTEFMIHVAIQWPLTNLTNTYCIYSVRSRGQPALDAIQWPHLTNTYCIHSVRSRGQPAPWYMLPYSGPISLILTAFTATDLADGQL